MCRYPSLLSKEAGRYNRRRNADKLIPGEVLPPCVETESRLLEKIDKDILSYLDWTEVAPKNPAYASHNGAIYRREDAALLKV